MMICTQFMCTETLYTILIGHIAISQQKMMFLFPFVPISAHVSMSTSPHVSVPVSAHVSVPASAHVSVPVSAHVYAVHTLCVYNLNECIYVEQSVWPSGEK